MISAKLYSIRPVIRVPFKEFYEPYPPNTQNARCRSADSHQLCQQRLMWSSWEVEHACSQPELSQHKACHLRSETTRILEIG